MYPTKIAPALAVAQSAFHFLDSKFSDRKRRIITHFTHVRVQRSSSTAAAAVVDEAAMEIHYIALLSFDTNRATAFLL